MSKKIILVLSGLMILICAGFYKAGYEIPGNDQHPDIPFFPETTLSDSYVNVPVDSMDIYQYQNDKDSKYILIDYNHTPESKNIVLMNRSFQPVYHQVLSVGSVYHYDSSRGLLYIVSEGAPDHGDRFTSFKMIDVGRGVSQQLKELDGVGYQAAKSHLQVLKCLTEGFDSIIFFEDKNGGYSFVRKGLAIQASRDFIYDESKDFNVGITVRTGGDPQIQHANFEVFDMSLLDISLRRPRPVTPPCSGDDGCPEKNSYEQNEGYQYERAWFDKKRLYHFNMRLKNDIVQFKSRLYYYSDSYFDQFNQPLSDQDTLFYFAHSKIYKFYKKNR